MKPGLLITGGIAAVVCRRPASVSLTMLSNLTALFKLRRSIGRPPIMLHGVNFSDEVVMVV